jgi:hypothetical protein
MKKIKSLIILSGLLTGIAACTHIEDKAIAGRYVTQFQNEYTHTNDTIVITAYNLTAHTYKIERHTGYNKVREGEIQPREFKQQSWTATYIKENQVLEEGSLGRKLYLKPEEDELLLGSTVYKLVK